MKKKRNSKSQTPASKTESIPVSSPSLARYLMIICGLLAFLLYANTLSHNYVVDDDFVLQSNKYTQEGISALPEIFSTPYRAGFWDRNENLYRPMSIAMFAVEWEIAPADPKTGHWVNVLLYAITTMIVFQSLLYFFGGQNIIIPFITTLLFAAHPIHTEVVANIKSRDEILCFLFSIISLWTILKYSRENKVVFVAVAGISIFLAMLSKETAVTMVAIAPLTVYFFSSANLRKIITCSVPFVAAFIIYFVIRASVLKGADGFDEIQLINNSLVGTGGNAAVRLATAIYIVGCYLWLLIFPHPLAFDYSYNTIPLLSFGDPKTLLSLVAIIGLGVIAIKGFKSKSPLSYGIFFFAGTLCLVSNIFFLIEATMAERFLYMPSLGFCIVIAFLLARIFRTDQRTLNFKNVSGLLIAHKGLFASATILLLLYGAKTITRNTNWKDDITLTGHDVKIHPNSVRIRYAYGSELVMINAMNEKDPVRKTQLLTEGIRHLTAAVTILPDYGDAWYNLGMAYKESGDFKNAIICFENAREHTVREEPFQLISLGVAYGEDKQYDKAIVVLQKAIQLDSASSDAYNNLGLYYSSNGNDELSMRMLNKAMQLNPKNDKAPFNIGNNYANHGDFKTAIEYYQKALQINPNSESALVNMGNSYGALKDYSGALDAFKKVLQINPSNEEAHYNIGVTYYMMGDTANAMLYLPQNK